MPQTLLIKAKNRFTLEDIKEIYEYRELFFTLVERDIKVRYKQTVIGGLWAIIKPLSTMVVFSFFFGKIAGIPSENIPYPIFSYAGLTLWMYFSTAVASSSESVVGSGGLISKVYFPRIIVPLASTMVGLVDYIVASIILTAMMIWFGFMPGISIIALPVVIFFTWLLASGVGLWLSATNVLYRDVRYLTSFLVQLWIYATPVIFPLNVAGRFQWIVNFNPMSGLINTHRTVILNHQAIDYPVLIFSMFMSVVIFLSGVVYFRSIEHKFADVI